jgi:hypothetical protein
MIAHWSSFKMKRIKAALLSFATLNQKLHQM